MKPKSADVIPGGRRAGPRTHEAIPTRKKFLFGAFMSLCLFAGLETVIRIGAYFLCNRSPYFLYYGFKSQIADDHPEGHAVALAGYSSFQRTASSPAS